MVIQVPETVQKYCSSKEATEAINLMLEESFIGKSLEEKEQYYKANLFIQHFLYDMWHFRYKLFQEIWLKILEKNKNFKMIDTDFCELEDYYYIFAITCDINDQKYHIGIIGFDGKEDQLSIIATQILPDESDQKLGEDKDLKAYKLQNENFNDSDEYYTRGREILLKGKTEITDEEINQLQEDAQNILKFINLSTRGENSL